MDKKTVDNIAVTAMLKRFTEQRLPRALDLEKKVSAGEKLNDSDLEFLEVVFNDAQHALQFTDQHPEYREIFLKALQMYSDITKNALENEKNPNT